MRAATTYVVGSYIDGRLRQSSSVSEPLAVVNPATEERLALVADGTERDVDEAVAAAQRAAPGWARMTPAERASSLFAFADAVDAHRDELASIEVTNVGKPMAMATGEVRGCADNLRFAAGGARALTAPGPGEYVSGFTSLLSREPVGVVAGIAAWNYPLQVAVWKLAAALAVGNTFVLKPSELTPLSAVRLAEISGDVLPRGVLNVVVGTGSAVGEPLVRHPGIALVSFTGSVATGRRVAVGAAQNLTRATLELGGKAPMVVLGDADVEAVVDGIRIFGYANAGQDCGAITRVIVERTVYDELEQRLPAAVESIVVGDPSTGPEIEMGPVISAQQRDRVNGFVDRALNAGARVVCKGASVPDLGYFISPIVLADVEQSSEIVQTEVFGPVVTLQRARDADECLAWANDTPYGLSASVWTSDVALAHRFARELNCGTVGVNEHVAVSSELPWGGFKTSGYGNDMSLLALEENTQVKHVLIRTTTDRLSPSISGLGGERTNEGDA